MKKHESTFVVGLVAMLLVFALTIAFATPVAADGPSVFINEIHYDNDGGDVDEGIEIAGPAGTDLTDWQLVPYNGSNGGQYSATELSGTIPDQENGFGTLWFPISGIQNGAPDGIALVAPGDVVVQFLSYEGDFTATDGPADGMTSTDIGVSEGGSTPVGYSLQLQGIGDSYDDFTWNDPIPHTRDAVNTDQIFQEVNAFSISKSAPGTVSPGEVFTYTLVVQNDTGVTPATTTITDVAPDGVAFVAASDGGAESDGVVTWTVDNFADGATITRTFLVTATAGHGAEIENADYGVNGGEDWITTTIGAPVTTMVMGECDSIYNVQYPGGDSLCTGETVAVEGIVYAVYGSNSFAIAEDTGPWHGVFVYDSGVPLPEIGDSIHITGTVSEYFGLTQLGSVTYTVLMTGTTPYTPSVISTAEAADGEAYEGVLVEVQDVIVSNEDLEYGEWEVDDGSGPVRVNDLGYAYDATLGNALDLVRGMLNYNFGDFKIEPRDADDIVEATGSGLLIEKHAPAFTPPGEAFTYTLTFENQTAQTINDLWISDTLPLGLTYASSSPEGTWDEASHTITWTELSSITHGSTLTYTLVVTAPAEMTVVSNTTYMVSSSDWPTPTMGDPVETLIRDCNSIYGIQHTTDAGNDGTYPSLCAGENVTVKGIVYAVYGSNYFIAEAAGPWHGIYVYNGGNVSVGDEVEVTGNVVEYYGVTEFSSPSNVEILSSGNTPYAPSVVTVDEIPVDDPDISEGYEGVFVETHDITVTAEANNYGIWTFTDSSGALGKADDWGYRAEPDVGDEYAVLRGALAYDYDEYKILPRDAADALEKGIVVIEKDAPATVPEGEIFTYTLTIANQMGFSLDNLVITDTVPDNTTFTYGLDGGVEENGVVSWEVTSLDYLDEISVRFVVTAADMSGLVINDDYAVSAANYVTPTFGAPVNTAIGELRIYHLQGEGFVSPYEGQTATVEGIVTADFQGDDEMDGFFMQDPMGDDNLLTSDGIFVYDPDGEDVDIGYRVRVTGMVDEYQGMTQIKNLSALSVLDTMAIMPPATVITLPEEINNEMERYEGMLVTLPHTMTVQQNYFQGRFGQVTLGYGDRMYQPTHLHEPGSDAYWDQVDENARRLLVLDDGSSDQNPDPIPYIGLNDTLRAGDVVATGLTGVLDQGPINTSSPATKDYRLHPTAEVIIDRDNERPVTPPDVGGRLQIASFNVLNYFTTFGERGADNQAEFDRQRTKIITALIALDADVVGLMEIENNGYEAVDAIHDLVEGLNAEAGAGTYAFIDPGVDQIGDDAIAVGLLYKPASVTPVGAAAILDNSFDPNYYEDKNRPALAQTFEENATGERFTAVVNHLKSKGSSCADLGDPDTGDGQGNCNLTRTSAMSVEVSWLATDPTNSGDPDFIIIGDLNSYAMEDPISMAKSAGYTDLLGEEDYTYIFDGQSGYLDYAMSNESLTAQVTDAAVWNINADEPSVIDYNTEYKPEDLYAPDAYRSSDHDPVLVGLNLLEQTTLAVTKAVVPTSNVSISDTVTYTIALANEGDETATGIRLTDTLPTEVEFGGWTLGHNLDAVEQDGVITWTGDLPAGVQPGVIAFTATVVAESEQPVVNRVDVTADNAATASATAEFSFPGETYIFLPLVTKY